VSKPAVTSSVTPPHSTGLLSEQVGLGFLAKVVSIAPALVPPIPWA
jgi:hypothetical protein